MKTLTTEGVNLEASRESIEAALENIRNNYEINKSHPAEKYYCRAIIEHDFLDTQKSTCTISFLDTETELIFFKKEEYHLSFLPPELIIRAKKVPLINVLVCLKLFYYSTIETMAITLVVPIGEDIGCFDNDIFITQDIRDTLADFYKKRKQAWMNSIPHPSYKSLVELEQKMLITVSALMSA